MYYYVYIYYIYIAEKKAPDCQTLGIFISLLAAFLLFFSGISAASLSGDSRHLLNVAVSRARVGGSLFGCIMRLIHMEDVQCYIIIMCCDYNVMYIYTCTYVGCMKLSWFLWSCCCWWKKSRTTMLREKRASSNFWGLVVLGCPEVIASAGWMKFQIGAVETW